MAAAALQHAAAAPSEESSPEIQWCYCKQTARCNGAGAPPRPPHCAPLASRHAAAGRLAGSAAAAAAARRNVMLQSRLAAAGWKSGTKAAALWQHS